MRKFVILFSAVLFWFTVKAQQWHTYTTVNTGLNTLNSMNIDFVGQTPDNLFWIVSGGLISTFDGTNWGVDSVNGYVKKFFFDSNENAWILTSNSVVVKTGSFDTTYRPVSNPRYNDFTIDSQDNVWLIVPRYSSWGNIYPQALVKYDGSNWIVYNDVPRINLRKVVADDQNVYIATDSGLVIFNKVDQWRVLTVDSGLVSDTINALAFDDQGNLWIGTPKGINKFDGTQITDTIINPDTAANFIFFDSNNNLWCATGKSLQKFDGSQWTEYSTDNGLPSNNVSYIYEDNNGTFWFATDRGLVEQTDDGYQLYSTFNDNGLLDNNNFCIVRANDGTLYITTFNGFYKVKDGLMKLVDDPDAPKFKYFWSATKGPDGKLYFQDMHDSIFYVYDGMSWSIINLPDIYGECAYTDSQGNMWFGSWEHGKLLKYDGQNFTEYDPTSLTFYNWILSISEDPNGNIVFTDGKKLLKFDGNQFSEITIPNFNPIFITELFLDRDSNLWIADYYTPIRYDGTNFTFYHISDSLTPVEIEDIVQDSLGNIWFVGNFGRKYSILKLTPGDIDSTWTFYGDSNGVPTYYAYSVGIDNEGYIYTGYYQFGLATNRDKFMALFNVSSESGALEGATVQVNGQTLITDPDGKASIVLPNGNYTAIVSKQGYYSDTVDFTIDYLSVELDVKLQPNSTTVVQNNSSVISVYPNPSHGTFFINSQYEIENIEVYSADGKKQDFTWDKANNKVSISAPGSYLIRITTSDGKQVVNKIIIR